MIFDIGILFILIIGFLRGIHRGLVVELFNLVGFFAATVGAIIFTTPVSDFEQSFRQRLDGNNH